jgi:2-oxo-4-hydroxy-4-carboxy-5-ureidoimidazoline decarboxylase
MTLNSFNSMDASASYAELERCCGSAQWISKMIERRPFSSFQNLISTADQIWFSLTEEDWKEAFTHHPKIGNLGNLRKKFATTHQWARNEQKQVVAASDEILKGLAIGNAEYERKFGYIFIVCAAGKGADEMLNLLRQRLPHDPGTEIRIAAEEQRKITHIRLEKLFSNDAIT